MEINIKLEVTDDFLKELLENLPEYAISYHVLDWNYKDCIYKLSDCETGDTYTLTLPKVQAGFRHIVEQIQAGKLFIGVDMSNILDGGNWDSLALDALLQASVLGEVIYG